MNKLLLQKKKLENITKIIYNEHIDDKDIAIVMCNYTNYSINEIKLNNDNIKFFYFTNNENMDNIHVIVDDYHSAHINTNKNKELMIEKFYKTQLLNIDIFKAYKYIVFLEKNIIINDINNLANHIKSIIRDNYELYVYNNKNIIDEHKDAASLVLYKNTNLFKQVKKNTHNKIYNIHNSNFIIYKNCDKIKNMMNDWWNEINKYTLNDKISLSFVLHKNNIHYKILYDNIFRENNINLERININTQINLVNNILWINLDRSLFRRKYMENLLKDINTKNTRISAIDGLAYNFNKSNITCKRKHLTNYEIACTMSHLKTINYLKNINGDYFMICEDDITFDNIYLFDNNLETIIKNAPKFDILILFKFSDATFSSDYTKWNDFFNFNCYSTACYIISRSGINRLSSLFSYENDTFTFKTPIDVADIFIYKNVNTYIYKYNYISVLNNESTIHKNHLNLQKKYTECQFNIIYN